MLNGHQGELWAEKKKTLKVAAAILNTPEVKYRCGAAKYVFNFGGTASLRYHYREIARRTPPDSWRGSLKDFCAQRYALWSSGSWVRHLQEVVRSVQSTKHILAADLGITRCQPIDDTAKRHQEEMGKTLDLLRLHAVSTEVSYKLMFAHSIWAFGGLNHPQPSIQEQWQTTLRHRWGKLLEYEDLPTDQKCGFQQEFFLSNSYAYRVLSLMLEQGDLQPSLLKNLFAVAGSKEVEDTGEKVADFTKRHAKHKQYSLATLYAVLIRAERETSPWKHLELSDSDWNETLGQLSQLSLPDKLFHTRPFVPTVGKWPSCTPESLMKQCLMEHVICDIPKERWPRLWRSAFWQVGDVLRFTPARGAIDYCTVIHSQARGFLVWPLETCEGCLQWSTSDWAADECRHWHVCAEFSEVRVVTVSRAFSTTSGVLYKATDENSPVERAADNGFAGIAVPLLKDRPLSSRSPHPCITNPKPTRQTDLHTVRQASFSCPSTCPCLAGKV